MRGVIVYFPQQLRVIFHNSEFISDYQRIAADAHSAAFAVPVRFVREPFANVSEVVQQRKPKGRHSKRERPHVEERGRSILLYRNA